MKHASNLQLCASLNAARATVLGLADVDWGLSSNTLWELLGGTCLLACEEGTDRSQDPIGVPNLVNAGVVFGGQAPEGCYNQLQAMRSQLLI